MAYEYQGAGSFWKNCAACAAWGGSRSVDQFGQTVSVESDSAMGRCLLQGGPWQGQDKPAAFQCERWEKWSALK